MQEEIQPQYSSDESEASNSRSRSASPTRFIIEDYDEKEFKNLSADKQNELIQQQSNLNRINKMRGLVDYGLFLRRFEEKVFEEKKALDNRKKRSPSRSRSTSPKRLKCSSPQRSPSRSTSPKKSKYSSPKCSPQRSPPKTNFVDRIITMEQPPMRRSPPPAYMHGLFQSSQRNDYYAGQNDRYHRNYRRNRHYK